MVDGRFRVACVCAAMLHASRLGKTPDQFLVGMHDFRYRHHRFYKTILHLADRVDGFLPIEGAVAPMQQELDAHDSDPGAKIFIFRRKAGITDEFIHTVWQKYRTILD